MIILLDRAVAAACPSLAGLGRGPGLVLRPLLWIVGAVVLAAKPDLARRLRQELAEEKLKQGKNDLYPLW